MQQIIEGFLQFIAENPWVALGIMVIVVVLIVIDRELTLLCPVDQKPMRKLKDSSYKCPKCGFVKEV